MTAASIRYNNPGAMWGGNNIARRWGATSNVSLNDGTGQGNTIAFFPDKIHGAAAQFDLWWSGYSNMTLADAIRKWSGGNSSPAYAEFLQLKVGIKPDTVITSALLSGPIGFALMKAQAQWEAGQPYPLDDNGWRQAQAMVFKGAAPPPPKRLPSKKSVAVAVGVGTAVGGAHQAVQAGAPPAAVLGVLAGLLVGGFCFWWFVLRGH